MYRTYEFRLKPTDAQEKCLLKILYACRFVYNWAIEDRRNLWNYAKCSTNYYDQANYLKFLKAEYPFLWDAQHHNLQEALRRVQLAFDSFFKRFTQKKKKAGYPRFKAASQYASFKFPSWGNGVKFDGKRLYVAKAGRIRIILHRPIVGTVKTCSIRKRADGWYALLSAEYTKEKASTIQSPIGLDVGLKTFVMFSNGDKIENPKHFLKNEVVLRIAQKKVTKRKKGSGRRKKAVKHLGLEHLRVARMRRDFHFKVAKNIVEKYNPIFVEDLNINKMFQNHYLAKSIADASWGQFLGILSNKAESAGSAVIAVEARGTSQDCSACGATVPKKLAERVHRCLRCGLVLDRDTNAARNILQRGLGRPIGEGVVRSTS